jgi:hypothetical protein
MEYRHRSPIGTFTIRQADDGYHLLIDQTVLATYPSPQAAYYDISHQSTGWDEWDRLSLIDIPEIEEWEIISSNES